MITEIWNGHRIRFAERDGEYLAILKDVCDALELRTDLIVKDLDADMLVYLGNGQERMAALTELGVYEAIFASKKMEARSFRRWSLSVLKKLREKVGLSGNEVMRMLDPEVQEEINQILDTIYWDEEKGCVMQSITVAGGDVEQVPFLD